MTAWRTPDAACPWGRARRNLAPAGSRHWFAMIALFGLALGGRDCVQADPEHAADSARKPRFLFVDADHPSTWTKGLEPISAGDLRRLLNLDSDANQEPIAQVEEAVYQATFRDGSLIDGRAELTLSNGRRPALVPLEDPDLEPQRAIEFSRLLWSREAPKGVAAAKLDALWGIDRGGDRVVIAEEGCQRLEGQWSLSGRPSLNSAEFAVCLPPAVVSRIVLRIPAGMSLSCDQGVLVRGGFTSDRSFVDWRIELGSRTICALKVLTGAAQSAQHVFYDEETTFTIGSDRLRMQSKLQLDAYGAPLNILRLSIPAGLRLETITYGDEFPFPIPSQTSDKAREISLELPEPLSGKGRTVLVEGSALTRKNQLTALPQVDVPGAVRRESQVQLTVRPPLKLMRFGAGAGLSQSEAPTYSSDGEETFFLRQNSGDPSLAVEVGEPAAMLAARTQARLEVRSDRCVLAADVACSATRGSTFSVAFELPDVWEVTRVEAVGDASRMIDETTLAVVKHRKRVKIDFFRAVTDREAKRFRIEASRPLPRLGEVIDMPVIEFPAFASQEVETLVVHGSSTELGLAPSSAFAAFDPTALLSALADSPLRPDRTAAADTRMLVHRWTAPNAKAKITLNRGQEILEARAETFVEVNSSQQALERLDITIVPASPLDRLLVYLPAEGPPFSWRLIANQDVPVEGTRLEAGRHAERNLPEAGELWELRLPERCRGEFHLRGTRRTSALGGARIGLSFVPEAQSFDARATIQLDDEKQFEVEPREARVSSRTARDDRRGKGLHYNRPGEVLVLRPRLAGASRAAARFASLHLTSHLDAAGDDFHRADFSIAPEPVPRPFHFHLDPDSRLQVVLVNGQAVRVQHQSDDVTVPSLPANVWNHVQIDYKTGATRRLFVEKRRAVVPEADVNVLDFHWRVFLAAGLQPCGASRGLQFDQPTPALSWFERLFGPLGRPVAHMPLSSLKSNGWLIDLAEADADSEVWNPTEGEKPFAGWNGWDVSAEELPDEISITIWHAGEVRTLSWIVCLGFLIAGLALARFAPRASVRFAAVLIAAGTALALTTTSPYAILAGACVSGTLFALVLSQSWRATSRGKSSSESLSSRPGSTVSFELRAVSVLVTLAALGAAAAFAQDRRTMSGQPLPSETQAKTTATDAGSEKGAPDDDWLVAIPVRLGQHTDSAALSDDQQLVYVSTAALESLRRHAADESKNEGVVFLSSDYAISLDERLPATIEAVYRIAALPGRERPVVLHLKNVSLGGADACRVDGRPYPILKNDDGFALTLGSRAPQPLPVKTPPVGYDPSGPRQPIAATRPSSSMASGEPRAKSSVQDTSTQEPNSGQTHVYEVRLRLFPTGDAGPDQFEIEIPQSARTSARLANIGPWGVVTIAADGRIAGRLRPSAAPVDLGQSRRLRLRSGAGLQESAPTPIAAQAVQFWRVSPALVEMDCRVTYKLENGVPQKITWLIPVAAAVRSTGACRAALRTQNASKASGSGAPREVVKTPEQMVPLDFDCSSAPDGPITLSATLILPITGTTDVPTVRVPLPRFDVASPDRNVLLTSNQVAITASSGYRVSVATPDLNLARTAKVAPIFRADSFGARKEPDLILDGQRTAMLPLQLAAVLPIDKVRLVTHEARISADRIQWKTTAEIRTENAPSYVHVLHVDPRLRIDSIAVREDDVERLVRYSQSGDEVTLFLRDRAAATQDLVLMGHLALELNRPMKLPAVTLIHATTFETRLAILHDPDVDVAVSDSEGVARAANHAQPNADLLEYSLSEGSAMPEIRVTRRAVAGQSAPAAKNAKSSGMESTTPSTAVAPRQRGWTGLMPQLTEQKTRIEVLTSLDLHRDRSIAGTTSALLERFVEPSLRFRWPASIVLRGALVDGRPVQPVSGDGWISLTVPSESIPHRISLYWAVPGGSSLSAIAHVSEELPVPADGSVNSILLSIVAPSEFRLWGPASFSGLDPSAFAALCDVIQSADRKLTGNPTTGALQPASSELPARLTGRLAIGPADAALSLWAVNTFWLRLPLAVAIFTLIALGAAHPYAVRGGTWLLARAPLTMLLVGLLWTLCLTPRAVGPLLFVIALGSLIVELRRRATPRTLPSTLHVPANLEAR
jgi:hypothetical protein